MADSSVVQMHTEPIVVLAHQPHGDLLASAGYAAIVRLWDDANGSLARTLRGEARVPAIAFSPDGRLLAGESHSETVRIWE